MKLCVLLTILTLTSSVSAEDLRKATKGLLVSSDCNEEVCHSYRIEVSQRFVRLPVKRQLGIVHDFCAALDKGAEDYQDEDGKDWTIQSCVLTYHDQDIAFRANDGRAQFEAAYIAALAALRDSR